ncbi:helix-turn-helix transcriptional regulator [Allocatelliglobosispora scoriae]|nr:LuxR family transcriptional regulator [Allocatelliglobosispora scoriae]
MSPVMVGRAEELATLREALTSTAAGRGGAFFLVGDAGLGKSRLTRECTTLANAAGMTVLRGRATPAGATVPYRPLTEALFSLARADGVPDDPDLLAYRPALARLIPEWRGGRDYPNDDSPIVLAEAVLRLLGVVGRDRGVLICLSDLHDGDAETMGIVEYLVDNLPDQPVLLLASMRPLPSPALTLARSSARQRVARVLDLDPLPDADVTALAAACLGIAAPDLPAEVAPWLARSADGNPFVVEELLRGAVEAGALVRTGGGWAMTGDVHVDVPSTVVASVTDRARRLGPQWHRALEAAAVVGRRFPLDVLQQISGVTDAGLRALVRAGVDAQLLLPSRTVPGWYTFRNAWTAEALASELLPAERAGIAAAAADAVEALSPDLPGEVCQLAASLRLAAGDRPAAGLLYAVAGRRTLAEGAATSAVRLLDQALELVPAGQHAAQRADVLATLLNALAEAGDVEGALRRGADLAGSVLLSAEKRAELHTRLAWVCVVGGHWEKAGEQVDLARQLLGDSASPAALAPVDVVEAHLLTLGDVKGDDRAVRAEELALRAVGTAEAVPLPTTACQARQVLALLARRRGFDDADVHLRHMLDTADRHALSIWRLRAQIRLATNELMRTGQPEQLHQARQAALDLGAITAGSQADATFAMQQVLYAEFAEAEKLADRILEATTRMHQEGESQFALVIKIASAAHQGRRDAMRQALADFRARGGEQSFHAPIVFGHRAICALLSEDRPGAEAEMARVREWERSHPTIYYQSGRYGLDPLLEILARRAGHARHAEIAGAAAAGLRWNRQFVLAAEAVLLGRDGDADGAAIAMAQSQQASAPFPMARHLLLRLVAEAALDDGWGDPVTWLREAETWFHTADVAAVAGACRSLLRRAGVRVMQRRSGLEAVPADLAQRGVTAREYEVLMLLGERKGNPEIAKLLFISPRTVEKHVAALMDKLGSTDRTALSDLVVARLP